MLVASSAANHTKFGAVAGEARSCCQLRQVEQVCCDAGGVVINVAEGKER